VNDKPTIQLLVSVVTLEEARHAVQGGADILDLKNPREGSLGAAHPRLIAEVCREFGHSLPVSAAIGDFQHLPNSAALAALCAAEMGADFVKIGLLGSRSEQQAVDLLTTLSETLAWRESKTKLIAAAYGDFRESGTLNPLWLPRIAHRAHISGCMIDTLNKKGACLFDHMSPASLQEFIAECREYGLLSSLAGSLSFRHIDLLRSLAPDILGVRGAVCKDGVRTASINREKVSQLKLQLAGAIPSARKEQLQCAPAD
jgi:(5-formylfuran-3-yl)methyl phosphate synthase